MSPSDLKEWFELAVQRWCEKEVDRFPPRGCWMIGYQFDRIAPLTAQELANAFAEADDGNSFISDSPSYGGTYAERSPSNLANLPQWWCANCQGQTFRICAYSEDVKGANYIDRRSMQTRIQSIIDHALRLANLIASDSERAVFRVEWVGLKGRQLLGPGNVVLGESEVDRADPAVASVQMNIDTDDEPVIQDLLSPLYRAFGWSPTTR